MNVSLLEFTNLNQEGMTFFWWVFWGLSDLTYVSQLNAMTCSIFCIKHAWKCIRSYILYLISNKLFNFMCWFSGFFHAIAPRHLFIFFLGSILK